jgi:signal transduction histidine kinase
LRGIANAALRIDEIIGRLTTLRQRPEVKPVEADLSEVVRDVLETLELTPHLEVTNELQSVPTVLADREQLRSVVTNLVLNARDAVGAGGRICVRTEQVASNVVLSVADSGCGMSPEFVNDSLFRPFQSTKKRGLGIGLFQSRMIVEAHGGAIRVESEEGKGSTFRVSLPVANGK